MTSPIKDKTFIICSIVRDAERGLRHNIPVIKEFCKLVKDYKILIFENDSKDKTKEIIKQWAREDKRVVVFSENRKQKPTIPNEKESKKVNPFFSKKRIQKMVELRNQYMDYMWQHEWKADYLVVIDLDVEQIFLDGILTCFNTSADWDAMTAFGYSIGPKLRRRYHDSFALIEYGDMQKPRTENGINALADKYRSFESNDPVRVDSAFGGIAIYRFNAIEGLRYKLVQNDDERVECKCEHTSIYMQMKERGYDHVYINPLMKVHYQRLTWKIFWNSLFRKAKKEYREKKKILFVMHLPPPVHGAAMMGKYIHDSKLINESFDCHYINLATAKNLEDIGQIRVGKIVQFVKLLHRIRKAISKLHPDLVYVTPNAKGGAFYKDFLVVEMVKSMGCKVVVHYHNKGVAKRQDKWLDDKLYRKFFKDIKVILLAEALYPDVQKYVRRENVFICPNGIPDETGGIESSAERHSKEPHILFLSNLIVSKGVLVLLDALKILKNRGYSFICNFVGGETAEIDAVRFQKETIERGLDRIAIYVGKKYGRDKDAYYSQADLFAFPTFYPNECFPLVLLEAMQNGLPCISTDEGGISGIIDDGKTGLLTKRENSADLADKIQWMFDHPKERKAMGHLGREKFQQEFTLQAFENLFTEILKQLIL